MGAATLYRSAKQELQSAKQDLESRKLMAKDVSTEQASLASKDDNADVHQLGKEAQELVDSANAEVHASETKVTQLTAQVAKLRATYLLETVSLEARGVAKVASKVASRSL